MSSDPQTRQFSWRLRARRFLYTLGFHLCRQLAIGPLPAARSRPCRAAPSRLDRGPALSPDRGQALSPGRSISPPGSACHVPSSPERPL